MRPNTRTVHLWDEVSLRDLAPAIKQGFALQPFSFNSVLATSLVSEIPVASASLQLFVSSSGWEQNRAGGSH